MLFMLMLLLKLENYFWGIEKTTTKRDLAKYLADYFEREFGNMPMDELPEPEEILEQGLDAFESTDNIKLIFEEN